MGSAYTPLANDAYAPTVNPAGLGFLSATQVAGMHLVYLEDTSFEYLSFVQPLGETHGLGGSIQYFRPGSISGKDNLDNPTGDFTGYYTAVSLAYGQRLGERVSLGVTGKYIRGSIADVSASSLAGEAGAMMRPTDESRLAFVVDNVGKKLEFLQQADSLPLTYHLGGAYTWWRKFTASLQVSRLNSGLSSFQSGFEWMTEEGFSFRCGYDTERIRELSPAAGLSIGVGMAIWGHELGYTWVPVSDLGSSHYISFVLRFGADRKKYLKSEDSINLSPSDMDMRDESPLLDESMTPGIDR